MAKSLNVYAVSQDGKVHIYFTNCQSMEELKAVLNSEMEDSDERIEFFHSFVPEHKEGFALLESLAFTDEVGDTLEEFVTTMFRFGQRFQLDRSK